MEERYRLAVLDEGTWRPVRYGGVFGAEDRWLVAAPDGSPIELLISLLDAMAPPYRVELEVLESEGLAAEEGRVVAMGTSFDRTGLVKWLRDRAEALESDARLAVLVHGSRESERIVYDEHNRLLLNGDRSAFEGLLLANGLLPGDPAVPYPHVHHYRPELTPAFAALLGG